MNDLKLSCPKCASKQTLIERRINGNCRCQECGHEWPNRRFEFSVESALAERDARIKELEAQVEQMKCCENCEHYSNDSLTMPCVKCDGGNTWKCRSKSLGSEIETLREYLQIHEVALPENWEPKE